MRRLYDDMLWIYTTVCRAAVTEVVESFRTLITALMVSSVSACPHTEVHFKRIHASNRLIHFHVCISWTWGIHSLPNY